jgi:hypothetical protein
MRIAPHQDRGAIAVAGDGQAARGEHGLEHDGVAMQIFGGAEVQGQDLATGIVERPVQRQRRAPLLQPGGGTPIEQHQAAYPGLGEAPPAMARGAPGVHRRAAQGEPDLSDRLPAERQALHLLKLLGQMTIVQAGVDRAHELGDLLPDGRGEAAP